jgi:LacI family transcriptional regulator
MAQGVMPTLMEVAKRANVSKTAASLMLRKGRGRYSESAYNRVQKTAEELGWRQNLLVNAMQTGKTKTIGVVVPPINSFWIDIMMGLHSELTSLKYMPITLWVWDQEQLSEEESEKRGVDLIHMMIDRRVDGLIFWPFIADIYNKHFNHLINQDNPLPVVMLDYDINSPSNADCVETNEELGGYLVAKHLLKLGHKKMVCLTELEIPVHTWAKSRCASFVRSVNSAGIAECSILRTGPSDNERQQSLRQILSSTNRPTAIFCVTDNVARLAYDVAGEFQLRIPEDLSVVGFGNLDFGSMLKPALTTVGQNGKNIGAHAARLVVDRAEGKAKGIEPYTIRVDCELVERGSTARI